MSATLLLKLVSANSPSLCPSPVKSKRIVAMPLRASAWLMLVAALMFLVHVKQCANNAIARAGPSGRSISPLSSTPSRFWNVTRLVCICLSWL